MKKLVFTILFALAMTMTVAAQTITPQKSAEILSNADVMLMTKAGLAKTIIIRKIKESNGNFDVSVNGLVTMKNAGVDEEIIETMMERSGGGVRGKTSIEIKTQSADGNVLTTETVSAEKKPLANVGEPQEILRSAKTVAIEKSSLNPSRQALEKELLKRKDWQALDLNLVRHKDGADLYVEIGFVPLSWITHRYVFRIYDNKTGTVIAAGETTSWGNLAGNLAREISKKLVKAR